METVAESVGMIAEQMHSILENMDAKIQHFSLEYKEIPNPYGGNPEGLTVFSAMINHIPHKAAYLIWQRQAQSEKDYINSIKAYMFQVLDEVTNL